MKILLLAILIFFSIDSSAQGRCENPEDWNPETQMCEPNSSGGSGGSGGSSIPQPDIAQSVVTPVVASVNYAYVIFGVMFISSSIIVLRVALVGLSHLKQSIHSGR